MLSIRWEGWWGHLFEKAYVHKELAVGTRLKIGVPFYVEASGPCFPEAIAYYNEAMRRNDGAFADSITGYVNADDLRIMVVY